MGKITRTQLLISMIIAVICFATVAFSSQIYNFGNTDTNDLLKYVFDTSTGHSHNGVDSKYIADPAAIKKSVIYQVEDVNAGVDIANRALTKFPLNTTIQTVTLISQGTPAGIDASNTASINVNDGTNIIASKVFNDTILFPDGQGNSTALTLNSTNAAQALGNILYFNATQGTTANATAYMIQVDYKYTN